LWRDAQGQLACLADLCPHRGAALSAGIGAGVYRDHADAVAQAVKLARRQEPNPAATPFYLARYAEYQRLLAAMQEPWNHLSRLSQ
jgi:phenylpropionate dioxygenase-like ring-hydroxylating dioxygenase large terminal subunit